MKIRLLSAYLAAHVLDSLAASFVGAEWLISG